MIAPADDWPLGIEQIEAMTAIADSTRAATDDVRIEVWSERLGPVATERARRTAREIVQRAYDSGRLQRLAEALLEQHTLTGEQITALDTTARKDGK